MTQDEMVAVLKTDGWRGGSPMLHDEFVRRLYKFFETPTHCALNRDKPGIQVECAVWEFPDGRGAKPSIEIISGAPDEHWKKINIGCNDLEDVARQIPRLLATWEFIANWREAA